MPAGSNRRYDLNTLSLLCHSSDSTNKTLVGTHMVQLLCRVKILSRSLICVASIISVPFHLVINSKMWKLFSCLCHMLLAAHQLLCNLTKLSQSQSSFLQASWTQTRDVWYPPRWVCGQHIPSHSWRWKIILTRRIYCLTILSYSRQWNIISKENYKLLVNVWQQHLALPLPKSFLIMQLQVRWEGTL